MHVTIASPNKQGVVPAALYFSYALQRYNPTHCITIGVCGATKSTDLLQTLVCTSAHYVEQGRVDNHGILVHDPLQSTLVETLSNKIDAWIAFATRGQVHKSIIHTQFLSGSTVEEGPHTCITQTKNQLGAHLQRVSAVEMETYSIFEAARLFRVCCLGSFKAVSDNAELDPNVDNKQLRKQNYQVCCQNATNNALLWIQSYFA